MYTVINLTQAQNNSGSIECVTKFNLDTDADGYVSNIIAAGLRERKLRASPGDELLLLSDTDNTSGWKITIGQMPPCAPPLTVTYRDDSAVEV